MKKIISLMLSITFLSNLAFADCDFKTGISSLSDGAYRYTPDCHLKVGSMVKELESDNKQIADLYQAITLKDLALTKSDERTQLWMDTSFKLEGRMETIDELRKKNDWLYFGLGALSIVGAAFVVGQLRH